MDRKYRLQILEENNLIEIVHGIIDSLWLKKEGASPGEYVELCNAISKEIGVQLNLEAGIDGLFSFHPECT
jgi:hypothetical protein